MEKDEIKELLNELYGMNGKEEKKMNYFCTISQGTNKIELTTDSRFAVNVLVEYINEINKSSDSKLSFRMDPVKED